MTEAYREFMTLLQKLGQGTDNPLRVSWANRDRETAEINELAPRIGRSLPLAGRDVRESTTLIGGGLDLTTLGLTGTARLMLLDGTDQAQFSIVVEESGNQFTRAVDFALHGFSKPK